MKYKYPKQYKHNWGSMIEFVMGIFAWAFVCAIMWWAVFTMLEKYTTN